MKFWVGYPGKASLKAWYWSKDLKEIWKQVIWVFGERDSQAE